MDMREDLTRYYDALAPRRDRFRRASGYYYRTLTRLYRYFVPEGKKVLEVGTGTGDLLNALRPSAGVGVDLSPAMVAIARKKYPHLRFEAGSINAATDAGTFDYVILPGVLGEAVDIQALLRSLRGFCTRDTRLVIEYYSYLWQVVLRVAEKLGLKMPQPEQNWLTADDIVNFLRLAGYELVSKERAMLCPVNLWLVSDLINRYLAKLPFFNALTLNHFIIARPIFPPEKDLSVTVLVPCRNEKGNIEAAVVRTPAFGAEQEFIFVEGHSKDGTYEEVERVIRKYPQKNIRLYKQPGKGKGDAVRFGFSQAKGDVLMILDADLTVMPEDLPKFYEALRDGTGEFINGCRLVYPLEKEAMRFLNLIANKLFGLFFSWLLGQRFKDTLCGTKVMLRRHYLELVANRHYFGDFDPFGDFDLIFGAVKLNLKVVELPVRYRSRCFGETQIQRFRHGLLLARMCLFAMKKIKFI